MDKEQVDQEELPGKVIKAQTISYRVLAEHRDLARALVEYVELISTYAPKKLIDNFELSLTKKQKLLYYSILGTQSMLELKNIVVREIKAE